ncbi:TraR/DksA family transcriptional regulator [Rhodococcus sp. NBC_00297]|uniref:TraR/DksA family transcriptional regulator n=1 Tax=Rhodococcus sp. NBC_00297 TaxID=2976005 RepID=UPI002E2A8D32|nr:TraR/DksA C4-type zinc finger protein [Rhodococcus sp. NBC_00297]
MTLPDQPVTDPSDRDHAARAIARNRVAAERALTEARIVSLARQHQAIVEGSRWTTDDDEHDPEGSTIAFERAAIASMSREAREELRELDDAEMRIERGTYGQCEVCGGAISDPRLEALPTARRCIDCTSRRR